MKDDLVAALLIGLLAVGVVAAASLSCLYVLNVRTLQRLQIQSALINQNRAIMRDLASEAVEYSKRNPSMERVLDSVGIKMKPAPGQSNVNAPTKTK